MDELFERFQRPILAVANNSFGRKYLGIDREVDKKIVKITPNSYAVQIGREKYTEVFRCYDLFAKKLYTGVRLGAVLGLASFAPQIAPVLALNTTPFYSGGGDGWIGNGQSPGSYVTARDAASGNASWLDYTSATGYVMINQDNGGGALNFRSFFPFNTAALGVSIPYSGKFSLYGFANYADTDGKGVCLTSANQASTSSLAFSDYSLVNKTLRSDTIILLNLTNGAYNDWPLNTAGIALINKTGFTKYGCMGNVDQANQSTSGPACGHSVYFSEQAATSQDPVLAINYVSPGVGGGEV